MDTSAVVKHNNGSLESDTIPSHDNTWGYGMADDEFVSPGELEKGYIVRDFAEPSLIMKFLLFNDNIDD